jgi:hypothetical protein
MSDQVPKPIDLSLTTTDGDEQQGANGGQAEMPHGAHQAHPGAQAQPDDRPVMGWIAATFGFLSIFLWGVVFVPLGIVCSIIALFMGQGMWAFIGLALSFVGLITSPILLGILGLAALASYFGIPI